MRNERGSVLVFTTLMIVVLLFLVGMGLDTGVATWSRNLGQSAVDSAALSAVSALPTGNVDEVYARASHFDNNYIGKKTNPITGTNVTLMVYDEAKDMAGSPDALRLASGIAEANAVRVSLESKNPYGDDNPPSAIPTPSFLTPILRLFGAKVADHVDVNVTATAVLKGKPDLPIALRGCTTGPMNIFKESEGDENACWTTYTIDPTNKPTIEEMLKDKSCKAIPPVGVGTEINFNNGEITTADETLVEAHGPFDGSQCFLLPVIPADSKCNQSDPIDSFARICIKHVEVKGNGPGWIEADVTCNVSLAGSSSQCAQCVLVRDRKSGM